ncbi:MAG: DUF924 family protein [Porticoccaceae bacterium]|nr:DUF924 domain-containing protein [Pseudomonadales bacterium]MCP5172800.1 DUF924 domain-containing protein [Pseudomonadales bacterium]MCP5302274.1 DUF924 domain-containing protein [Pseudomonadales bacterium]
MGQKEWQVVLDYWFGDIENTAIDWQQRGDLWWGKHREVDQEIRDRFAHFVNGLSEGGYRDWLGSARGRLAAIVVVDQFSRNLFRGEAKAFAADPQALQWCLDGIDCGDDLLLKPVERVFFYMPLEHSESPAMQQLSITNYRALVSAVPEEEKETFRGFLDFAQRHYDVIARFGRYPHRNKALGRESTPEEMAFMEQSSSF